MPRMRNTTSERIDIMAPATSGQSRIAPASRSETPRNRKSDRFRPPSEPIATTSMSVWAT